MKATVLGTARVLPGDEIPGATLSNARLAQLMHEVHGQYLRLDPTLLLDPCDPEFPEQRLGVLRRRVLDQEFSVRDMAVEAGKRALLDAGADVSQVGGVIVSTSTPDGVPAIACTVQSGLGLAEDVVALDVLSGCNGFLSALSLAEGLLARGITRPYVLVISAETMVRVLDASDRTTAPVCGDGAGAALLGPPKVGATCGVWIATQGDLGERIQVRAFPGKLPIYRFVSRAGDVGVEADPCHRIVLKMEGREVFKDMVRLLPPRIEAYCERHSVRLAEIDLFLFHQANARMISGFAERLLGPDYASRVPMHIDEYGNTSSASIAILLDQMREQGRFGSGQRALLCGFGAGYSLGMALLDG